MGEISVSATAPKIEILCLQYDSVMQRSKRTGSCYVAAEWPTDGASIVLIADAECGGNDAYDTNKHTAAECECCK
jgi:hypothetical protein